MTKTIFAAASALLLAGCSTYGAPGYAGGQPYPGDGYGPPPGAYPGGPPPGESARCPINRSANWKAWVDRMPGPDRPTLHVTGDVVTATAGYKVEFQPSLVMRESYPAQAVAVLEVTPPQGPAAQVVETHQVKWQWPVAQQVGSLEIVCRGETLTRIDQVGAAY